LSLQLHSAQLSAARRRARDFLATHGVHRLCIEDVLVALTEATVNAAQHSGAEVAEVELALLDDHVQLTVADRGRGFDFSSAHLSRRPSLMSSGGRGLYLIWCVMDSVHVDSANGTTITMTKLLRADECLPRTDRPAQPDSNS
jgi:anti-sigma regulatory factor (Ser/Thr protein kinase)